MWLRCEPAKTSEFKTRSRKGCYLGLDLVWRRSHCRPRSRLGYVYVGFKSLVSFIVPAQTKSFACGMPKAGLHKCLSGGF